MKGSVVFATILALVGISAGVARAEGPIMLNLPAMNMSGQTGSATLTQKGSQVEVILEVTPGPAGVTQPAHIHEGSCANLGGIKYPLTNVVAGKSMTTIAADLAMLSKGTFALNVHKSTSEAGISTACADIAMMSDGMMGGSMKDGMADGAMKDSMAGETMAGGSPGMLPKAGDNVHAGAVLGALALGLTLVSFGFVARRRSA